MLLIKLSADCSDLLYGNPGLYGTNGQRSIDGQNVYCDMTTDGNHLYLSHVHHLNRRWLDTHFMGCCKFFLMNLCIEVNQQFLIDNIMTMSTDHLQNSALCGPLQQDCGDFSATENRADSAQVNALHRIMYSKEIVYAWSNNSVLNGPITAYEKALKMPIPADTRSWTLSLAPQSPGKSRACNVFYNTNATCIHGMNHYSFSFILLAFVDESTGQCGIPNPVWYGTQRGLDVNYGMYDSISVAVQE
jgi:hypothetical protein